MLPNYLQVIIQQSLTTIDTALKQKKLSNESFFQKNIYQT